MTSAFRGMLIAVAAAVASVGVLLVPGIAPAQQADKVLNLYSSHDFSMDEALFTDFTARTGIVVNRLEADGNALIERLRGEGGDSPADMLFTDDAGWLWRAGQEGLLGKTRSFLLEDRIPANLRDPDGRWFGLAMWARVIVYNRHLIDAARLKTYEDLADPGWRNQVCVSSSRDDANLSLLAAMIEHRGIDETAQWARGVVANFARDPLGGDTDQLRAVAAGECGIGLVDTRHYARLLKSARDEDKAIVANVGVIFPDQDQGDADGRGAHVNIAGAGILARAPHPENARAFLEYMAAAPAQRILAEGNGQYPVVPGLLDNPALADLGPFEIDALNVGLLGVNRTMAQEVFDRVGWK